jgi:hypothetical protein
MVTSIIQHGHHINDLLHWIYFFVLDSINYFFHMNLTNIYSENPPKKILNNFHVKIHTNNF